MEVGPGTACRNRCESDVGDFNTLIAQSKINQQKNGGNYLRNAIFAVLTGLIFAAWGLSEFEGAMRYFMAAFGGLMIFQGISLFFTARRFCTK